MYYYKFPEVVKTIEPAPGADFLVEEIKFQVDEKGALWDIFTNSIYTHEFDYIRELIQNEIDATLLKYYTDENFNIESISPKTWKVSDKVYNAYKLFENTIIPAKKNGTEFQIKNSKLYQDGIFMEFNPQIIVPLGVGWSICNLTAGARFELNASRHEINMNRKYI